MQHVLTVQRKMGFAPDAGECPDLQMSVSCKYWHVSGAPRGLVKNSFL